MALGQKERWVFRPFVAVAVPRHSIKPFSSMWDHIERNSDFDISSDHVSR